MDINAFLILMGKALAIGVLGGITRVMLYEILYRNSWTTVLSKKTTNRFSALKGIITGMLIWGLLLNWSFLAIACFVVVANILLILVEQKIVPMIYSKS